MNILHVISSKVAGGRELFCVPVALRQKAAGHKVSIMCRKGSPVEAEALRCGIDVLNTRFSRYINPIEIFKAAGAFRRARTDIIHSHWTRDLSNLIFSAALAGGIPIVCTKHVYSTVAKKDIFHTWAAAKTKYVMCVCELVHRNLLDTVNIRPEKAVTVYNGIDTSVEWVPGKYGNAFRKEAGIDDKAFLVCMAGRINSGKGQHTFIAAAKEVVKKVPGAVFVLAGRSEGAVENKYLEALANDVKSAGLKKSIRFLGFRTDLPAVMDACDAVVMCSVFETFGLVLIQGMALAKPVIGTNAGGVPEIITDKSDGQLFNYGDNTRLAEILLELADDPAKRAALGKKARETAVSRFDISNTVAGIERIYLACEKAR